MNKELLLHNKTDKNDLIKKYYLALIPLLLFSLYKNGILLYHNDLIHFSQILIPIYFTGISILVGYILSLIRKESTKENILLCLIISCTVSINTNWLIYPILLFISLFIGKTILEHNKITFNLASIARIMMILGLLLNSYSYLNIAEKLDKFNYNLLDIFIGHGIGGLAATSTLLLIFCLIILSSNKFYKKIVPITSSLVFISIGLIYYFFTKDASYLTKLLNGTTYFSFIFIGADLYTTPHHKRGMLIYGILIGLLTSLLSIFGPFYEASYISIFLLSPIIPFINKMTDRKQFTSQK